MGLAFEDLGPAPVVDPLSVGAARIGQEQVTIRATSTRAVHVLDLGARNRIFGVMGVRLSFYVISFTVRRFLLIILDLKDWGLPGCIPHNPYRELRPKMGTIPKKSSG